MIVCAMVFQEPTRGILEVWLNIRRPLGTLTLPGVASVNTGHGSWAILGWACGLAQFLERGVSG